MIFTISSFLSITLIGTLLFLAIGLCFDMVKQNHKLYISALLVCSIIVVARLFVPIEFSFQKSLGVWSVLPIIYDVLNAKILEINGFAITFITVLMVIWVTGIIVFGVNFLKTYFHFTKKIRQQRVITDKSLCVIYNKVLEKQEQPVNVPLLFVDEVVSPMLVGVLKPVLAMPELDLDKKEMGFVFEHELAHYRHRDMWIKMIMQCLCIIYWWNPGMWYLRKKIDLTLEVKADAEAVKGFSTDERMEYVTCLKKVFQRKLGEEVDEVCASFVFVFESRQSKSELGKRCDIVLNSDKKIKKSVLIRHYLAIALIMTMTFLSYTVVFEPCRASEENVKGTYETIQDKTYLLVVNPNGGYDLYSNNQLMGTVAQIDVLTRDAPIYDNLEEALQLEK